MSQHSEMMGSFVRTGNYPLEANYIFPTESDLITFFEDPINNTILHEGLLKIVLDDGEGNLALYWVVNDNDNLQFNKLISFGSIEELTDKLDQLEEDLKLEIEDRKLADAAIWGTDDPTIIDHDLNSIFKLAQAATALKKEIEEIKDTHNLIEENIKAIVGTEEDNIIEYLKTLDYKNLTEISETLHHFLSEFDEDKDTIDTWPELQAFLDGFGDDDTLLQILTDLWHNILGSPLPNTPFRTLRGVLDFYEELKSYSVNRMNNIQTELDQTQVGVGLSGDGAYNADLETYYLKNATSVMNALKILDSLINEAINNCNIQSKDTETVDIDIKKEATKTTISAKVKLSSEDGNDIIAKNDGIYHNIDSEYADGILTIKVNGNVRLQHVLGLSSIVETAYYDPNLEAIIIVFKLLNGDKLIINIPSAALISEWIVDNSHANKVVELTKDRVVSGGADKLSADVRISTNKYNILEKDANTLLVKGTADNIIYDGDVTVKNKLDSISEHLELLDTQVHLLQHDLSDEVERAKDSENQLLNNIDNTNHRIDDTNTALDNEIQRAKDSEKLLTDTLNTEIKRSVDKDKELEDAIRDENLRAVEAETKLTQDLNNEIQRSTNLDQIHTDKISKLESDTFDLNAKIDNEVSRAILKENDIVSALNNEITRATNSEIELLNNIDKETERASNVEKTLDHKIEDLKSLIDNNFTNDDELKEKVLNIEKDLTSEIIRAKFEELELVNKIKQEEERATNKESALDHRIDDLKEYLDNNFTNDTELKERVTNLETNLTEEISRAKESEHSLEDSIKEEKTRAEHLEDLINKRIDDLNLDLTNNIQRTDLLIEKTDTLSKDLIIEITRAQTAELDLSNNISELKTTVDNNYSELLHKINSEQLRAENAEDVLNLKIDSTKVELTSRIDSEVAKLNLADTDLLNNINLETERATNAEKIIDNKVENNITTLINHEERISNLETKSIEHDTALSVLENKIDTVKDNVETTIGNKIDTLQDALNLEISRSTLKDDDLDARINNLNISLESEISRAQANEKVIELRVDTIENNLSTTILDLKALSDKLNYEIVRSVDKDTYLENLINNTELKLKLEIVNLGDGIEDDLNDHIHDYSNPHKVTAEQVGLGKVDNTTDLEKPISVLVLNELNKINIELSKKAEGKDFLDHLLDNNNPHNVTKEQVGLGNVDNTSDMDKPISNATQIALDKKSDIWHKHVMADIEDLENIPLVIDFIETLLDLPEEPADGDRYLMVSKTESSNARYLLLEYDAFYRLWKLKLISTGMIASMINKDMWKLNSSGPERILDVSDYLYFYNKIYDETKNLIEDIDWEEDDEKNDTNNQIRLKITYKTSYGDPNESEATNPYVAKAVKYIDIDKARFLANAYTRPATLEDLDKGYGTALGEPLLILVMTTGDHVTISLKEALNIYDPIDTASIDMSVTDWTGTPSSSYKVSAVIRIASTKGLETAVSLHVLDSTEKGMYATLHTSNTNSISLNPSTGSGLKTLSANLNINNSLNNNSDVLLTIDSSGLSAKIIVGEYD